MKLDLSNVPEHMLDEEPRVGDVYRVMGGSGKGRRFQAVVAIGGDSCYMLVFDGREGEICGVTTCAKYYLGRRDKVGRIHELPDLRVDWDVMP